jgi:hypothetical protein
MGQVYKLDQHSLHSAENDAGQYTSTGVVRDCVAQLTMNQDSLQGRILVAICQATPDQAARHCDVEGHQFGQAEC